MIIAHKLQKSTSKFIFLLTMNPFNGIYCTLKKNATKCCGQDNKSGIIGSDTVGNSPLKRDTSASSLYQKRESFFKKNLLSRKDWCLSWEQEFAAQ